MQRKRRSAAPHTFQDQIAAETARVEAQIAKLPPGPEQDALIDKIRQLGTASDMYEWLKSPR
jgi:hypothetical protein